MDSEILGSTAGRCTPKGFYPSKSSRPALIWSWPLTCI